MLGSRVCAKLPPVDNQSVNILSEYVVDCQRDLPCTSDVDAR